MRFVYADKTTNDKKSSHADWTVYMQSKHLHASKINKKKTYIICIEVTNTKIRYEKKKKTKRTLAACIQ